MPMNSCLHSLKMIDMDIEEIDDNSSQEGCPPATTATTKKRSKGKGKSKKEPQSPAVSSSSSTSTLTRFLGPAGPPSLSAWEDVNRQCPVCQQAGFSSRSLALHVNECLDVGSNAGAGAGAGTGTVSANDEGEAASSVQTAKKGPGTAGGRNAPTAGSARRPSNPSHAAGAGSREGVARTPQAVPSKNKAPASNGKAAKKAKTQQDGRGNAGERQGPGVWRCMLLFCFSAIRTAVASLGEGHWLLPIPSHLCYAAAFRSVALK